MKRHFTKSLKALYTGVMTLCVASLSLTSCYDDSALNARVDDVQNEISAIDARLQAVEALTTKLEALTARVDALYTLKFQVTATNELQYSFDGGNNWVSTGIVLAKELECTCEIPDPCTCLPVSLKDNGTTVTITVGEQSFSIEKPQEIVFEIRSGKVYFESEGTQKVAIKSSGIEDITVMSYPKGWYAEIASDGMLDVTAPNYDDTQSEMDYDTWTEIPAKCSASGYVKVHACSTDGKCMVGKLPVEVSNRPVSVKAYGGKAYFTATSNTNWAPEFYYGMSPRESFEAEVAGLLSDLNAEGWSDYAMNDGEFEVVADVAELLGAEPEAGVEYVAWAIVSDWNIETYTMDNFVVAYYSLINVTAVEDESQKTAYNVTATVTVEGVDKYLALALPANYLDYEGALEDYKMNMLMSLDPDSWSGPMGKYYTDSYTGSVLDIAEGSTASMSGNYAPNLDIYLLIIPMDGRSWDEYTEDDIFEFKFTTAPLQAGGSVDATAEQVFKYMAEQYSYEIWDFVTVEKIVDEYSQVAVEVKPSADNWVSFYYQWLDDATYNLYGGEDELLVDLLLKEWGMTPSEVEFPYYGVYNAEPATTYHFVAMFVDEAGKYGKLAKVSATTKELVYSDIMFTEPYETNLADGVLKNTTEFKFKPTVEGGTASSFKYYWLETKDNNPYEGKDDAELAATIHFDRDNRGKVVKADELVDGYLVVPNNAYGGSYMIAVLPYDENGAPGKSAAIFEFTTAFVLDNVITDEASFVGEPEVKINLPAESEFYPDGDFGTAAYYGYEYQSYYKKYLFYYEFNYEFTPAEGTTVATILVNANSDTAFKNADAKTRAEGVWQKSYGSYYAYESSDYTETSFRYFNHTEDVDAPDVYLAVSWKDADGNYYYKEYSLQADLQKYADKMYESLHGNQVETLTVDGKQWILPVEFAADETIVGADARSILDLGVSAEGYLLYGVSYEDIYGSDAAGIWMQYGATGEYTVEPTDATSGTVIFKSYTMYDETEEVEIPYTDLTATTCTFDLSSLLSVEGTWVCTLSEEVIPVQAGGVAM